MLRLVFFTVCIFFAFSLKSQVHYGVAEMYGLRKLNPGYGGKAIQVRRTCDNGIKDIGFSSCGDLDNTTLFNFVVASDPLSAISSSSAAAFSMRKLNCTYAGSCVRVRRSCDNGVKDIGFTVNGDLDTTSLRSFVLSASPLSAISSSAAAAFSLRKLRCAYAGNAIRIRRSSDNATQDIGFTTNGDLDTTSLKTFVGANNGFITIWYDQSTNGNNASQGTNGNQPELVVGGVINRQSGMPAAIFSAALTSYLAIPYAASMNLSSESTTNAVFARTGVPTGDAAVFDQSYVPNNISAALSWNNNTGAYAPLSYGYYPTGTGAWQYAALASDVAVSSNNIITGTILSGAGNTSIIKLYQNGTLMTTASNKATVGAIAAQQFFIGKRWDVADYAPMYLQELIVFSSVISTTDQKFLEWGQSQYYSVAGPSFTTLPVSPQGALVTTWYDQSSNARNASQATAGSQPRIMNAGVIDRQNGMPAIYFPGMGYGLFTGAFSAFGAAACFNGVARVNSDLTYNTIVNKTQVNIPGPLDHYNGSVVVGDGSSFTFYAPSQTFNAAQGAMGIWTYQGSPGGAINMYLNSTSILAGAAAASFGDPSTPLAIGSRNDGVTGLNGWVSEVVTFAVLPSATDRLFLEWSQSKYYTIGNLSLGALPASPASAYVTTWYDQSGNGRDLTQATTGKQPQIVSNGVILQLSGKSTVVGSNASQTNLTGSVGAAYTGTGLTAISAFQPDITSTANLRVMSLGTGTGTADWSSTSYFNVNERTTNQFVIERNGIGPAITITAGTPLVLSVLFDGTNRQLFNSGTTSGTTADNNAFNFTHLRVLQSINPAFEAGEAITGRMSEFSMFHSGLSTTRRTLIETNMSAYYNITVSGSKYTPPAVGSYNLFVTGIGRTSATDSVADSRQSVGMGFISGITAGDYLKDNGDYITAGIDCPLATVSLANLPATLTERWANDWYINKTDVSANGGNLQIFFDFSDYGVGGAPGGPSANYVLLGRNSTAATFSIVTTTAVSLSGDRVTFTLPAANLGATGYYTIGSLDYENSNLPVELLKFSAVPNGEKVDVSWSTATETNNHYFTVERSVDAIGFSELGKVNSKAPGGNSLITLSYGLTDPSPMSGTSYYRLKQTDHNGAFKYFQVVSVEFVKDHNITFSIYPNPNSGEFTVDFSGIENNHEVLINMYDEMGRVVHTSSVYSNSINSNTVRIIPQNKLAQGKYFCSLEFEGIKRTLVVLIN